MATQARVISLKAFEKAPRKARKSVYDGMLEQAMKLSAEQALTFDVPAKTDPDDFRLRVRSGLNSVAILRMGEKAPGFRVDLSKDHKSVAVSKRGKGK